ncbi:MAG: hypothetical protein ACLUN9_25310, partial [Enterocloster aldenensis]
MGTEIRNMGRNRNVVQGITAWVGKQTPSGGWTWAVPVSCFGCIYFGSLSIVGGGFVKIPPQFYEKGSFY